jgi:NAD(P)-dependent dehydrogenase (short-subunit alcohol dehydrogenase family)
MTNPVIIVLGAGPGVGAAVARRFGQAGYDPALISRSQDDLDLLGTQLQSEGLTTGWTALDLTDAPALTAAIARFGQHAGEIQHLHFNPSVTRLDDPLALTPENLLADVHVGVASLLTAVQAARPFMRPGARITATGSMSADHPWAAAASVGVQKAGLRNLVKALDATLAPAGIRAVSITVAGTLKADSPFDPRYVADAIFDAAQTEDEFWASEVRFTGRD